MEAQVQVPSLLYIEIKEMFTRKRKNDDLCHGDVQKEIRLVVIFTRLQTFPVMILGQTNVTTKFLRQFSGQNSS